MKTFITLTILFMTLVASVEARHPRPHRDHHRGYVDGFFDGLIISTYVLLTIDHDRYYYNQELIQLDAINAQNSLEMFGELEMSDFLTNLVSNIQADRSELSTEDIVEALASGEGLDLN